MGKIVKLDQHIANLIAAGEVIERVSSVVKELVENAIDADASSIKIDLVENGLKEIMVTDNGCGMDATDARNSVLPHHTSKIKEADDLFNINTLGFRGEALPSICAVSNLIIKSSEVEGKGVMLRFKDGALVAEATIAHPKGTTIIVRDLFYNTPARLATLSSGTNEASYVTDYLTKVAFAYPDIAFCFTNNGKTIFQTYGNGNELEVISSVYGFEIAKEMLAFAKESNYFSVEGYTSKISVTRSTKSHMTILVNGRVIRNYNITNAILKGYGNRLMNGKYPLCILHITTDPAIVDVNVHPAKAEVRFSFEEELDDLVASTINEILESTELIIEKRTKEAIEASDDPYSFEEDEEVEEVIEDAEEDAEAEDSEKEYDIDWDDFTEEIADPVKYEENAPFYEEEASIEDEVVNETAPVQEALDLFSEGVALESNKNENQLPLMHCIGQLFGTYILAEGDDNFYLIDQHAAAERINYERIYSEIASSDISSYELLVPMTFNFSPSEALIIESKIEDFNKLGIELESFGGTTYVVRSVGTWIPKRYAFDYLEEIYTSIINGSRSKKEEFLDSLAKSIACKSSIKGNEYHNMDEAEQLLKLLNKAKHPFTCPHGRPVIVKFSKYEIEKWFKRVL